MNKITLLLTLLFCLFFNAAFAQKVSVRVIDNKGTIKWVLDSTTAVITRSDSTLIYVTPHQMKDSLTKYVQYADTAAMLGNYINDAGNGLTKDGQKAVLGGILTQATTIQTSAANFLKITGLQSGSATDSVMTVDPASGQLKIISVANLVSALTAGNGLNKVGNSIRLGGTLDEPTTINTTTTNTLSLQGLGSGNLATDSILVADNASGALKRVSASNLLQSGEQSFTATAGQLNYAVSNMPSQVSRVWVFRNGAKLIAGTDYAAASGSVTLTPTSTPPNDWTVVAGDIIEVQWVK